MRNQIAKIHDAQRDDNEETTSKNRTRLKECGDSKREIAKCKEDIDTHSSEKKKKKKKKRSLTHKTQGNG